MIQIQLLEDCDVIQEGDFIRQLSLIYDGQSDYLATTSAYGGAPMNRLQWIQVERRGGCPAWIGKTVGEFRSMLTGNASKNRRHSVEFCDYEFVRGNLPLAHVLPPTDAELYESKYKHLRMPVGKHKGKLLTEVKATDYDYFMWAADKGIISHDAYTSLRQFS